MNRCYDDNLTPVRCVCGNIPRMTKADPNSSVITLISCEYYACNLDKCIIGANRFVAVRMWNDMIREIVEE